METRFEQPKSKRLTVGMILLAGLLAGAAHGYFVETTPTCVPDPCPPGCRVFVFFDDLTHEYEGFIEVGC